MSTKNGPTQRRYPPELRERAVRMVLETIKETGQRHGRGLHGGRQAHRFRMTAGEGRAPVSWSCSGVPMPYLVGESITRRGGPPSGESLGQTGPPSPIAN